MNYQEIIQWLLQGDVAIQYQVHRDLLNTELKDLQQSFAAEGWGANYLSKRNLNGHWGREYYYPKWTATHYTLLNLRNLCISPDNIPIKASIDAVLRT